MDDFRIQRAYRLAADPARCREATGALYGTKLLGGDIACMFFLPGAYFAVLIALVVRLVIRRARIMRGVIPAFGADATSDATLKFVAKYGPVVLAVALLIEWPNWERRSRVMRRIKELVGGETKAARGAGAAGAAVQCGEWRYRVDQPLVSVGIRAVVAKLREVQDGSFRPERQRQETARTAANAGVFGPEETRQVVLAVADKASALVYRRHAGDAVPEETACKDPSVDCAAVRRSVSDALGASACTVTLIRDSWRNCPTEMVALCQVHRGSEDTRALLGCETRMASLPLRRFALNGYAPYLDPAPQKAGGPADPLKTWTAFAGIGSESNCAALLKARPQFDAVYFRAGAETTCAAHREGAAGDWAPAPASSGFLRLRGSSPLQPPQYDAETAGKRIADEIRREVLAQHVAGAGGLDVTDRHAEVMDAVLGMASYDRAYAHEYEELTKAIEDALVPPLATTALAPDAPKEVDPDNVLWWLSGMTKQRLATDVAWPLVKSAALMRIRSDSVGVVKDGLVSVRFAVRWVVAVMLLALVLYHVVYRAVWPRLRLRSWDEVTFVLTSLLFVIILVASYAAIRTARFTHNLEITESNTSELIKRVTDLAGGGQAGGGASICAALGCRLPEGYFDGTEQYRAAYLDQPPSEALRPKPSRRAGAKTESSPALDLYPDAESRAQLAESIAAVLRVFDQCNNVSARGAVTFPFIDVMVNLTLLLTSVVGVVLAFGILDVGRIVRVSRSVRALTAQAERGSYQALDSLKALLAKDAGGLGDTMNQLVVGSRVTFSLLAVYFVFKIIADVSNEVNGIRGESGQCR